MVTGPGFKFNFFDSLLKLGGGIIFYLLNLSANLLFHTYKQLNVALNLSTLSKNFSRNFKIFFLFNLIFPRKRVLTLHANCFLWRQFACNVKTCFLRKIRKISSLLLEKKLQNFSNSASGSAN